MLLTNRFTTDVSLVHIVADKNNGAHHRHSTDPIVSLSFPPPHAFVFSFSSFYSFLTTKVQTFHTEDCGDVVAWLTRNVAADGGRCVISSAATVYNVLSAARPDLIRVLAAGNWPFALPRYQCRPVIFNENGKVLFNFGRASLLGSSANPRKAHLPALNTQQQEALDAIEAIARATEFGFRTQPVSCINFFCVSRSHDLAPLARFQSLFSRQEKHLLIRLAREIFTSSQI